MSSSGKASGALSCTVYDLTWFHISGAGEDWRCRRVGGHGQGHGLKVFRAGRICRPPHGPKRRSPRVERRPVLVLRWSRGRCELMSILDGTDFKRVGIIDGGDVHSTLLDESDQLQGQLCVFLLSSIFIFAAVEDPNPASRRLPL
jgi:hypothetical protein